MSDSDSTHFQFSLANIDLEISGDRDFVERMYRRIMLDIEEARNPGSRPRDPEKLPDLVPGEEAEDPVVWVHRCTEMMHKIYMSSPAEIERAPLMRTIDAERLSVVYADDDLVSSILPSADKGHTLWAELTEAGRRRIAEAQPDDSSAEEE